jgi:plasmid stability protein
VIALIALSGMAQLLVRNIPDDVARSLKKRAAEHGVSAEEEHRRILQAALAPTAGETSNKLTLFDHIRELGRIAPDFELGTDRSVLKPREIEF